MRYNLAKHRILEALSDKLIAGMSDEGKAVGDIKVSKSELINLIGKNKKMYSVIIAELRANDEIVYLEPSDSFIINTTHGLSSFSDKKYLEKNRKIIVGYLKTFAQIFIPIASLFVASMALWIGKNSQREIYDKQIIDINSRLDSIMENQYNPKSNINNQKSDSLPKN